MGDSRCFSFARLITIHSDVSILDHDDHGDHDDHDDHDDRDARMISIHSDVSILDHLISPSSSIFPRTSPPFDGDDYQL